MTTIAILATKISSFLLRLIHRGGSLPGSIGLRLCPNILHKLRITCPVILVTGTNGKTSTSNMIAELFEYAGKKVISNRKGDNLRAGITTTLLKHASLTGNVHAEAIVLEVDELNVPYIINSLPVNAFVVTNFFRDQLDRAREMEQLIVKLEKAIKDYKGTLVLNGNDPNVVRLKDAAKQADVMYYGIHECESSSKETKEASEGKFCPRCGSKIVYDFYQYSHIGKYQCSSCDFKTPQLHVEGEVVSIANRTFTYEDMQFHAPQGGLYTMYNCMAMLCVGKLFSIDNEFAKQTFDHVKVPEGRNESFVFHNQKCILNLVKNPTGANEVMKVIEEDKDKKTILLVLNDNPQDGTDVSWIYDTMFEKVIKESTEHIICSGTRAYDMALRLKYGGYRKEIEIHENLKNAADALLAVHHTMYVIATYTALQPIRNLLRREGE